MAIYFFTATKSAHLQLTKLFDFVWPTAAAMWNLRWQVAGYLQIVPNATVAQLRARFAEGADIQGANLQRSCIEHSWDEQKETFAKILLTNTIAIYESWIDRIFEGFGRPASNLAKALQFPDSAATHNKGVVWAIGELTLVESEVMRNSFHSALRKNSNYAYTKLDQMLLCYRFFKELRNCDMHAGGVADARLAGAYGQFAAVASKSALGVSEVPLHLPVIEGDKTRLSLRGVVGFSHLVLKIMCTLDAELSRSNLAERSFIAKWKAVNPAITVPSIASRRRGRMKGMLEKALFPESATIDELSNWLKSKSLLHF